MKGLAIALKPVFMTLTAFVVDGETKRGVFGRGNVMGGVTSDTCRSSFIARQEQLTVDTLIINFLDKDMTLTTGLGDVVFIDF